MKKVFHLLFFFFVTNMALAQHVTLNDSVASFGNQVAALLESTQNNEAASIGQDFNALWAGSFTGPQQKKIIEIAVRMQDLKHPAIPFQRDFFGLLTSAVNQAGLSGTKVDHLLEMLWQSIENNSSRNVAREMVNLRMFFDYQTLHRSKYNSLYAFEADYDFEYTAIAQAQSYADIAMEKAKNEPQNVAPSEEDSSDEWDNAGDDSWDDTTDDGWGDTGDDGWGDTEDDTNIENQSDTGENTEDNNEESAVELTMNETKLQSSMPEIQGAVIQFSRVDLIMATQYDSVKVEATKGAYMLDKYLFVGETGKFDFSAAGLEPEAAYVTLDKYSFNTRNPYLEASNVKLYFPKKITTPAKGYFEFKSVKHDSATVSRFPKFISYDNDLRIENLGDEHLVFIGGIALSGNKIKGASAYGRESMLEYLSEDGKKFKTYSKLYDFGDSVITSYHARVAVYNGRDSITHPSVKARYYTNSHRFIAIKDHNGYNVRPWDASYYKMTIDADDINWDLDSDSLDISIMNAKSMLPAYFKSDEYFDIKEIKELTGVYNFNPLLVAYSYGSKRKTREFYVTDLIDDLHLNEKAVRGAMQHLEYLDFIEYDNIGGRIYLKDKAIHFVRSKKNRKDYDDLLIPSLSPNQPNSTLHLKSEELTVRGIEKFFISEILDVYIYPKNNEIQLLKNRDFKFDGQLFAGNFEFVGRNFTFRYDSFLVDLQNIDSVKFYVEGGSQYQKKQVDNKLVSLELHEDQAVQMATNSSTSGTLYINRPDNKSGRKIYPQYPVFDADRGAIVYFDNKEVLNGAYDKSVYFIVPPFGIDSLSSSDPSAIGFEGTFVTGGILPEFKEKLKIMPDNSLGFEHTIPQEGFELYGGQGKIFNKVQLDKSGLVANGKIDYLTSTSYSDKYVLYLDSVVAEGNQFRIEPGDLNNVSFPDITTENFKMKWLPEEDHMFVYNTLDSFRLYNNSAALNGFVDLTSNGVKGNGTMTTRGFESKSEDFSFSQTNLMAKHSFFKLASDNPEKPLLTGDDIRLEFDFSKDIADISPEIEGMAALNFPYAQIKTSISNAQWNLNEHKVYMTKPADVDISNSYFYATRKELDSLAFNAEAAVYDIPTSQLTVSGIPYIKVADAMITPENNKVLILENAQIGKLYNTTIVIDTLNGYHRLIDGTIQIHSRKDFSGDATYQFVNALQDTFNTKFGKFELWKNPEIKDAPLQTVSSGMIEESDKFKISEGMYYKGNVTMYARNKALKLDGYVQFDLQSRPDYNTWIAYSSQDEKTQDVKFDFNNAVTEEGKRLNAGLHYGSMDNNLYATFAEKKKLDTDEDFFKPAGIVKYDDDKDMYMIEDTVKTNGHKFSGKVFGYNDNTGDISFEGPVQFVEPEEHARLTASGFGSGNIKSGVYKMNSLLKFDYKLPDQALTVMAADMYEVIENFGAPEAENDPDAFLYKVAEIIGERATEEYERRSAEDYLPIASFTPKMAGSLVFSKVNLEWSPTKKAWYSTGKIGLSNILKADLNALIDGFIEIKRTTDRGPVMNIYLQVSSDCWYYFGFEDNRLIIYSSNDEFVDIIASKSNVNKAGFGEYVFVDADLPDVLKFVNRFRLEYLGIKEPYELSVPTNDVNETSDYLEIPEDNSEDGTTLPGEDDNTGDKTITDTTEQKKEAPKSEEDLLNPTENSDKTQPQEDDDEGF